MNFKSLKSVEFLYLYGSRNASIKSLDGYFPALETLNRIQIYLFTGLYDFSPFKKFADVMTEDSQWNVTVSALGTVTLKQMQESETGDFTPGN